MIIKLKAKVLLETEEQMEVQSQYDLGDTPNKDKKWVWRNKGVIVNEIYSVTEYNSKKSLIMMHDEELIMVAEPFDSLFDRWKKAKELSGKDPALENSELEEENNKTEEEEEEDG